MPVIPSIQFDQIQGNIFGGFLKDHQMNLILRFDPAKIAEARAFLREVILPEVSASTSEEVLRFNAQFKELKSRGVREGTIEATWTNVAFTRAGLELLGFDVAPLEAQAPAFYHGMAASAANLGDTGVNAPEEWIDALKDGAVHAIVLVGADSRADLAARVEGPGGYKALAQAAGIIVSEIGGETRMDDPGHEHFGFKDGVSQPAIAGVNTPDDPVSNPFQGHPGQDMLMPGEFVVGYGRGMFKHQDAGEIEAGEHAPVELPAWCSNGSFLVFRRLAQDVAGFNEFVARTATALGTTPEHFGAMLVGRFKSGAPLEKRAFAPEPYFVPGNDPGLTNRAVADDDTLSNNFEFADDRFGHIVPLASHIRKTYPRDQVRNANADGLTDEEYEEATDAAERDTQRHRLLRRGIPFGESFGLAATRGADGSEQTPGDKNAARGLLFFCYQTDLVRQFEFVQQNWVQNPDFPEPSAGRDPIIGQDPHPAAGSPMQGCPFHNATTQPATKCPVNMDIKRFVKMTGGAYFFSPSIDALEEHLKESRSRAKASARRGPRVRPPAPRARG